MTPQQQRSAKAAAKRQALDERELRHRVRPGIRNMMADNWLAGWIRPTDQMAVK